MMKRLLGSLFALLLSGLVTAQQNSPPGEDLTDPQEGDEVTVDIGGTPHSFKWPANDTTLDSCLAHWRLGNPCETTSPNYCVGWNADTHQSFEGDKCDMVSVGAAFAKQCLCVQSPDGATANPALHVLGFLLGLAALRRRAVALT
jgi:hypothetical protein